MSPGPKPCIVIVRVLCLWGLLLAIPDSVFGESSRVRFDLIPRDVVESRLKAVVHGNTERARSLSSLFLDAGCTGEALSEQIWKKKRPPNIICKLPGTTESTIVVGAHSDHVTNAGMGAVDDWSGAALLVTLFQSLHGKPRKHTLVFVAFAAEEDGLLGSKFFVKSMTNDQIQNTRAMVNIECLGLGPTKVWPSKADKNLLDKLLHVAYYHKLPLQGVNFEHARDDAMSFADKGVPTISLHSITRDTVSVLHSREDTLRKINLNSYYQNYLLIVAYLDYLDVTLQ